MINESILDELNLLGAKIRTWDMMITGKISYSEKTYGLTKVFAYQLLFW